MHSHHFPVAACGPPSQTPVTSSTPMTPRELSDFDDIATALIVDPYLGFTTHKMNLRFRTPKPNHRKYLKSVVDKFLAQQDYEKSYNELCACDWTKSMTIRKPKTWHAGLKEHVMKHLQFIFQNKHF
jgi:histone-lysine N-methyltransferase SUV420H